MKTKTITVRMLDGKTGNIVTASNFLVRVDRQQEIHANWMVQNEDGTGTLTVPADATLLSIRATYEKAMSVYTNCDSSTKSRFGVDRESSPDHWYAIADILSKGVVTPNGCAGKKQADKLQIAPKPGVFVFFVRRQAAWESDSD